MKDHPYLRAYMAGVLLPSWVLLVALAVFLVSHFAGRIPVGLESAFIFPMAIVPNLWGVWNVLYLKLGLRGRISIGAFGSLLPLVLVPAGFGMVSMLNLSFYTVGQMAGSLPIAMIIYYLVWKYVVAFFNRIVE